MTKKQDFVNALATAAKTNNACNRCVKRFAKQFPPENGEECKFIPTDVSIALARPFKPTLTRSKQHEACKAYNKSGNGKVYNQCSYCTRINQHCYEVGILGLHGGFQD
jgi:hypothetical protein